MARLCGSCLALDHVASPRYQVSCTLAATALPPMQRILAQSYELSHFVSMDLLVHSSLVLVQSLLVSMWQAVLQKAYQRLDLQAVTPFAHSVKIVPESCSYYSSLLLHGPALQFGTTAAFTVFKFASGHLLSWYCISYWRTSQKLCLEWLTRCPLPGVNA